VVPVAEVVEWEVENLLEMVVGVVEPLLVEVQLPVAGEGRLRRMMESLIQTIMPMIRPWLSESFYMIQPNMTTLFQAGDWGND
jgi:hypothetical protein